MHRAREPQDCLNLIKTNITAVDAAIASAGPMASPASGETPLAAFLSVMDKNARTISSTLALRDVRYLEALILKGNKSFQGDNVNSFAEIVSLQDHIFKCAEAFPPFSATDHVRKDHERKMAGCLLEICSIVAGVIRQEAFDMVRQVESTSIGETKTKCSSSIDKIQSELTASRKLLADMQLSLGSYTTLKTPQSNLRDQRVLECEEAWGFTHTSYTNRSSLGLELDEADADRKRTNAQKKVTFQSPDGTSKTENFKAADKAASLKL